MAKSKNIEIEIEAFRQGLAIDKHSLDTEISNQPRIYEEVGEAYVKAAARRDFLKEDVSRSASTLYAKYRRKFEKAGQKATEAQVNASVQADPTHIAAVDEHIKGREQADLLQSIKEAYHQRSYMLRDLVALSIAGYYERTAISDTSKTRQYRAEKVSETIAKAREGLEPRKRKRKRETE